MAAPNDVQITRVFTTKAGNDFADFAFNKNETFDVIVEAEAGSTIHGGGGPYEIGVAIRNLTDSSTTVHNLNDQGAFGDAAPKWDNLNQRQRFGPFSAVPANPQGVHCYEALAYVRARNNDPDVSFVKSDTFMIFP